MSPGRESSSERDRTPHQSLGMFQSCTNDSRSRPQRIRAIVIYNIGKHHKEEFRGDCSSERASRKSKTSRSQQNQVVQIARGSASNAGTELFLNNSDGRESITTLAVTLSPSNCARQIRSYSTESLGVITIHKTRHARLQCISG